jgi:hypothetical protein
VKNKKAHRYDDLAARTTIFMPPGKAVVDEPVRPYHDDDVEDDGGETTPLQQWLQQHRQHRPTLIARITYAQELYLQAVIDDLRCYSRDDPPDILLTLQETPLARWTTTRQ